MHPFVKLVNIISNFETKCIICNDFVSGMVDIITSKINSHFRPKSLDKLVQNVYYCHSVLSN